MSMIIIIEGSDAQENSLLKPPPPKKEEEERNLSPIKITWKMRECSCDPLDGNNSIVGNFHKLSCQCANHNSLATLHLEYVKCPIFLTMYMQRIPKKNREYPNIGLDGSCEHKGYFYMNIKFISLLPKQIILMFIQNLH
jgi:hypothetical protein